MIYPKINSYIWHKHGQISQTGAIFI